MRNRDAQNELCRETKTLEEALCHTQELSSKPNITKVVRQDSLKAVTQPRQELCKSKPNHNNFPGTSGLQRGPGNFQIRGGPRMPDRQCLNFDQLKFNPGYIQRSLTRSATCNFCRKRRPERENLLGKWVSCGTVGRRYPKE